MSKIYAWPDGTWMNGEEYEDATHQWMGDDFVVYKVENDVELGEDLTLEEVLSLLENQ